MLLALFLSAPAGATQWVTMGPRAMAMGGAYTAIAEGPVGAYYNPGALGQVIDNPSGVQVQGSGRAEFAGLAIQGANDYFQVAKACKASPQTADCTTANIRAAQAKLSSPGSGAIAEANGGVAFKFGRLALFAYDFGFLGATPQLPKHPLNTNTGNITADQTTALRLRGGSYYEFGAGYGREILETGVFVGMNIKGIVAQTGYTDLFVAQEEPMALGLFRDAGRSTSLSVMPAVDVGVLWDARQTFPDAWGRPRFGVVGRNVNNPHFSRPTRAAELGDPGRFYDLQGQSRFGAAFDLTPWWTISGDLDITQNLTQVEGYVSRLYGVGTEFRLVNDPAFSIPVRAGLSKNIAQGDSGTIFSGGVGLHVVNFYMDLAAAVPQRWQSVREIGGSQKLPQQLAVSFQLSMLFGGAESVTEPNRDPFAAPPERREPERRSPTYFP